MSYLEYNGEKYLIISDGSDDYRCYFFESLEKIQEWLDSGSFDEGALLIEISSIKRLEYERITNRTFQPIISGVNNGN